MNWEEIIAKAEKKEEMAGYKSMAGDFTNIVGSFINYNALKSDLSNLKIQASNVELAAKQQANQIREQYLQAASNYSYNAARRGISVSSGSVRHNLEGSAEAMGKDIQRLSQNASVEARALRTKAKIGKIYGRAEHQRQLLDSATSIATTMASM